MAILLEAQSALSGFFSEFGYLAPFTVLLLCGFGLPIPEEVTMLGSGFLLYQGQVEMLPIIAVCFVATLMGDSIPYWLGRKFGRKALRVRSVRRAINPARIRALERRFKAGGARAVFVCRFVPGLRLPAWFTAGSLGMPYSRFLAFDGLGALIMTPFFVLLGRASGEKIAELESSVENLTQILGFVVVSLAAVLLIHFLVSKRLPQSAQVSKRSAGQSRRSTDSAASSVAGSSPGPAAPPTPPAPEIGDGDRP